MVRKFRFLAACARIENQKDFKAIESLDDIQFDELETFEHTKCKPLSVIIAVDRKTCKGKRGCVTGQGELKKVGFDPLFSLNHTFAMFRANMNRLFRKTWCTTKVPQGLIDHIDLYIQHHNRVLVRQP